MSSTVQAGKWQITSNNESADEMVKALTPPEEDKAPKILKDRGKEPEKDERDPAAVALGKKGGEAAAKAREEKAKEAEKDEPKAKPAQAKEKSEDKAPEPKEQEPKAEGVSRRDDPHYRIQQLTNERRAMKAELDELRGRLERQERARTAPEPQERREEPQKANPASDEPVLDQFESYEDWIKAHTRWEVKQELAEERKRADAERYTRERQETANKRQETFREKVKERAAEWADMDHRLISMMRDAPPIMELSGSDEVGPANYITEAITQSEDPTGFARYLSENERVVVDLLQASPWELPMKLGKIEARFAREAQEEPKREAPRTSQAPPPIRPLATSSVPDEDFTKEMSYDEFIRRKHKSGRG